MSRFLKDCQICKRLGKAECGYHKFKNECLSKMSKQQIRQQYVEPTQTSLHGISGYTVQQSREVIHQNSYRSPVRENYQETSRIQNSARYQLPQSQVVYRENSPFQGVQIRQEAPHQVYSNYQPGPMPAQNHIVRVEGDQVLYYPIYPVYEVVYEPVNTSMTSTPSRVLYN